MEHRGRQVNTCFTGQPARPCFSVAALDGPGDATLPLITLASLCDPFGTLDHESRQGVRGAQLWSFTTGGPVDSSPAVVNGVVYVGSDDGNVYALNPATGAPLWSFATGEPIFNSSPVVANGVVYVGSDDGNLYAFDLDGGLAAAMRPSRSSLHPDYSLQVQR